MTRLLSNLQLVLLCMREEQRGDKFGEKRAVLLRDFIQYVYMYTSWFVLSFCVVHNVHIHKYKNGLVYICPYAYLIENER